MDFNRLKLIFHTVKHLKLEQVAYRVFYALRKRFFKKEYSGTPSQPIKKTVWEDFFKKPKSYFKEQTFCFLNIEHQFSDTIDWNFANYGKLWTYNLNYFDFLNQSNIEKTEALILIQDYINRECELQDGLEPYPISLRLINWIKFVSRENIDNTKIQKVIFNHYRRLLDNLEYHILGNHLLENGFSLLFGAFYFQDNILYQKAKKIIEKELKEQILNDGAHFELSPMYQQIILDRLLDCIHFIEKNPWRIDTTFLEFLKVKASEMLYWLNQVTFKNGDIPMVNDSSFSVAPKTIALQDYAEYLKISPTGNSLNQSGYRKVEHPLYELFMDVGNVGPSYQPGHAHADTFSFVLYIHGEPFIVDPGVSTYNIGETRAKERATNYHNTVSIHNKNSSQVWAGFRVAKRARVKILNDESNLLKASHNGFKKLGYTHIRSFDTKEREIKIIDQISSRTHNNSRAFIHFHPDIPKPEIQGDYVCFPTLQIKIEFKGFITFELDEYEYALGFNNTRKAYKLILTFDNYLQTIFSL